MAKYDVVVDITGVSNDADEILSRIEHRLVGTEGMDIAGNIVGRLLPYTDSAEKIKAEASRWVNLVDLNDVSEADEFAADFDD